MKTRNTMAALALCGATALATSAFAGETEYGGTFCSHSKMTMLQANPDVTAFNVKSWGIQTPDSTFKPWANATNTARATSLSCRERRPRTASACGRTRTATPSSGRSSMSRASRAPGRRGRHRQVEGRDRRRDVPVREFKQAAARRNRRGLHLA